MDHTDLFGIEDISSNDLFLKAVFFFIFALARPTIQSQCFVNGPRQIWERYTSKWLTGINDSFVFVFAVYSELI